jgi:hypothetical protein
MWSSQRQDDISFRLFLIYLFCSLWPCSCAWCSSAKPLKHNKHFSMIFEQLHSLQPSIQRNLYDKEEQSKNLSTLKISSERLMQKDCTCSQIHSPLLGNKVDSGIGAVVPARQPMQLDGLVRQTCDIVNFIPLCQGL